MRYSIKIGLILLIVGLTRSASVGNEDVVWFPNPNGDGPLLPAKLTSDSEPKPGDPNTIKYFLMTKNNPTILDEIEVGNLESVTSSHYISGAPTKILIHGWGGSYRSTFPWETSKEYLKVAENYNLILVEWGILADGSNYLAAVENTRLVSRKTADLVEFLIAQDFLQREDVHIVGFSLGGQIAGQIGSRVTSPLPRITALDPALPMFDVADLHNRTDPSDADSVEVIHTAGNLLGFLDPCGTVDFYPNGGRTQPGCGVDITGSCAHSRAPAYYLESIESNVGFYGRECADYASYQNGLCNNNPIEIMGHPTPQNARGIHYLRTNAATPFAIGQ